MTGMRARMGNAKIAPLVGTHALTATFSLVKMSLRMSHTILCGAGHRDAPVV